MTAPVPPESAGESAPVPPLSAGGAAPLEELPILSRLEEQILQLLVAGEDLVTIAEEVGVCRKSLSRWTKDGQPLQVAYDRLQRDRSLAADACRAIIQSDPDRCTPSVRLGAIYTLNQITFPSRHPETAVHWLTNEEVLWCLRLRTRRLQAEGLESLKFTLKRAMAPPPGGNGQAHEGEEP